MSNIFIFLIFMTLSFFGFGRWEKAPDNPKRNSIRFIIPEYLHFKTDYTCQPHLRHSVARWNPIIINARIIHPQGNRSNPDEHRVFFAFALRVVLRFSLGALRERKNQAHKNIVTNQ